MYSTVLGVGWLDANRFQDWATHFIHITALYCIYLNYYLPAILLKQCRFFVVEVRYMPLLPKRRCRMGPQLFVGLKGERFFATVGTSCSRLKSVRQLRTQMTALPTAADWYLERRLLTPLLHSYTNTTWHDKLTVQYSWRDKSRWRTCTSTFAYRLNVCDNIITSFKSHGVVCSVPSSLHKNYRTCTRKLETEVNVETKKVRDQ